MFGTTRWHHFDHIFNFQREGDRQFNQLWNNSPVRSSPNTPDYRVQVHTGPDHRRVEIPMPCIDPEHVSIDVAGNNIIIRAEQSDGRDDALRADDDGAAVPRSGPREGHSPPRPAGAHAARQGQREAAPDLEDIAETQKQLTTA